MQGGAVDQAEGRPMFAKEALREAQEYLRAFRRAKKRDKDGAAASHNLNADSVEQRLAAPTATSPHPPNSALSTSDPSAS